MEKCPSHFETRESLFPRFLKAYNILITKEKAFPASNSLKLDLSSGIVFPVLLRAIQNI